MTWTEIRGRYPHQWLMVEALQARSELGKRHLDKLAVVDAFPDGEAALRAYLTFHRDAPKREIYVLHSDREELDITEQTWLGLRTAGSADEMLRAKGLAGLEASLGPVGTLRFLALLSREPFDYQSWRDKQCQGMSLVEILTEPRQTS